MTRWLIEMNGEPFDLEEDPRAFPEGDAFAIRSPTASISSRDHVSTGLVPRRPSARKRTRCFESCSALSACYGRRLACHQ